MRGELDPHSFGMARPGERVIFTGQGGYDSDREEALRLWSPGTELLVQSCEIGDWQSSYRFEGWPGSHNTVMFDPHEAIAQLQSGGPAMSIEERAREGVADIEERLRAAERDTPPLAERRQLFREAADEIARHRLAALTQSDARNAALEEAAKVAFEALYPKNPEDDWTPYACDKARHARTARDAIRNLIKDPTDAR